MKILESVSIILSNFKFPRTAKAFAVSISRTKGNAHATSSVATGRRHQFPASKAAKKRFGNEDKKDSIYTASMVRLVIVTLHDLVIVMLYD